MADFLPIDTIRDLTRLGVEAGLATDVARSVLMGGINRQFVASIPSPGMAAPADQLQLDLLEMNDARLIGGEVPLKRWLENALWRVQRAGAHAAFKAALERVAEQATAEAPPEQVAVAGLERVVHADDLLPFDFLAGALATGAAVARLTVSRHEHGAVVATPGTAVPARSSGTGWLLSPDQLITNFHVIAARSESEDAPSPDDLALQALTMVVEFDLDRADAAGTPVAVTALVASDPTLDYAVVQLADPGDRRPLRLASGAAVVAAAEAQRPVNIIQHPGGMAKEMGIRNNLIASHDATDLRYFTDTLGGTSGSPVCTDDWHVVALHKSWIRVNGGIDFQGKTTAFVNRGTRIDLIAAHLGAHAPQAWAKVTP